LPLFLVAVIGCSSNKPVKVLVTKDGTPVSGAMVVLTSSDNKSSANGETGADGVAAVTPGPNKGVPPGTYKVTVTKISAPTGGPAAPGSPEAMKMMTSGGRKSELPLIYGDIGTSPLTLTVPPPEAPAKIELKSNP